MYCSWFLNGQIGSIRSYIWNVGCYEKLTFRQNTWNKNEWFLQLIFRFTSFISHLICDLFYFIKKQTVTSYADDTTSSPNGANVLTVLNDIENKASNVFDWFSNNYLKGDPDKSNLLVTFKEETENCIIQRSVSKKLLGVTTINSILLSVFKNYVKKRVKNSMLLHKFWVTSPQMN